MRDLAAERFGDHVDLHWTVPTLTTDRQPLVRKKGGAGPLTAELCRIQAAGPCTAVARLPVIAGQSATTRDVLSGTLLAGVPRLIRYRVRVLNAEGRFAGWSRDAVAVAGAAPPAVMALAGTTTDRGIQLTWNRETARPGQRLLLVEQTLSREAAAGKDGSAANVQPRTLSVHGDPGGTIDPTPRIGDRVTYTVYRTQPVTLEGKPFVLNGGAASVTLLRQADTFPPAVPTGVLAVSVQLEGAAPEIDLSWEPDTEPDLLGYVVYRAEKGSVAAPQRLTPTAISAISYRDLAVSPGHSYRYSLTAVDRSGNESGKSAVAEESLHP